MVRIKTAGHFAKHLNGANYNPRIILPVPGLQKAKQALTSCAPLFV